MAHLVGDSQKHSGECADGSGTLTYYSWCWSSHESGRVTPEYRENSVSAGSFSCEIDCHIAFAGSALSGSADYTEKY